MCLRVKPKHFWPHPTTSIENTFNASFLSTFMYAQFCSENVNVLSLHSTNAKLFKIFMQITRHYFSSVFQSWLWTVYIFLWISLYCLCRNIRRMNMMRSLVGMCSSSFISLHYRFAVANKLKVHSNCMYSRYFRCVLLHFFKSIEWLRLSLKTWFHEIL